MKRVNIYLDDETHIAAQYIREHHGIPTDSGAVRYAIREIARRVGWKEGSPPKPRQGRGRARHDQVDTVDA